MVKSEPYKGDSIWCCKSLQEGDKASPSDIAGWSSR